jgi:hypothetical protein
VASYLASDIFPPRPSKNMKFDPTKNMKYDPYLAHAIYLIFILLFFGSANQNADTTIYNMQFKINNQKY